jgi:hypothetical protein
MREEHDETADDQSEDDKDCAPTEEDAHHCGAGPASQARQQEHQGDQTGAGYHQAADLAAGEFHVTEQNL